MTESIRPRIIRSVGVDQFIDNFDPSVRRVHEGGFVMEISLISDGTASPGSPGFGVRLDVQQVDRLLTALDGVTSVDVTRNKASIVEIIVTASALAPDEGAVVISDPGPRLADPRLVAMLAVVPLQV
jgi:hypothetical protein